MSHSFPGSYTSDDWIRVQVVRKERRQVLSWGSVLPTPCHPCVWYTYSPYTALQIHISLFLFIVSSFVRNSNGSVCRPSYIDLLFLFIRSSLRTLEGERGRHPGFWFTQSVWRLYRRSGWPRKVSGALQISSFCEPPILKDGVISFK